MTISMPEPLESVFLRLEHVYAADRSERDPAIYGDGTSASTAGHPDGLNQAMLPCLIAVCLIPNNEPEDYATLFRYFADDSVYHREIDLATLVVRIRTTLFKCTPLVGVVQVTNALQAMQVEILKHPRGQEIIDALPKKSTKPTKTAEEDAEAGWAFFSAIYERHAKPIIDKIGKTSPDLAEMIVNELYGANLARNEVLSWRETVLIEFVGCAALDCPAQAKGHFFGCRNLKVGKLNVKKAIEVVRQVGMWRGEALDDSRMPFLHSVDDWQE